MIDCVFIVNPIRKDFIERCLETLHKHTHIDFRVIVVDQTLDGLYENIKDKVHMYLRPHRNLGFSKSMNEGIIHAMHWKAPYIMVMNDDLEFMDDRWWDGIIETFKSDERIMAVNPMSPREPGWGYGLEHGTYFELLDYKKEYTKEEYDWLLEGDFTEKKKEFDHLFEAVGRQNTFPDKKVGMIDAIATWGTVFKRECIEKFGLFDERFYPGGGEDYDYNARVYREGYRMVGTTRSWVWHWWGSSKDQQDDSQKRGKSYPIEDKYRWMNPDFLWPPEKNNGQIMDPWGKWTDEKGEKHPMYRVEEIGVVDI